LCRVLALWGLHYMACPWIDSLGLGLPVAIPRIPQIMEELEKSLVGTHTLGPNREVTGAVVKVLIQPAGALMCVIKEAVDQGRWIPRRLRTRGLTCDWKLIRFMVN